MTSRKLQQGNPSRGNKGPAQAAVFDKLVEKRTERLIDQGFTPAEAEAQATEDTCRTFPLAPECQGPAPPLSPAP